MGEQHLETEVQRKAMSKLVGLQFRFQYRRGLDNGAADALSRVGKQFDVAALSTCQPTWVQEVANSYETDADAQERLQQLAVHSPDDGYELYRGLIRRHGRLWIGANTATRTKLIAAMHNSAVGGHSGSTATYQRMRKLFDWRGLKRDVEEYVRQCTVCQQAKHEHSKPAGLLAPLPIPTAPWEDLTMDFAEGLPASEGYDAIMVVVDRFTKFAHFVPLRHPFTATQVARAFWDKIVKLHGVPSLIVSDRDKVFTSNLWRELLAGAGTKLLYSTAYHPQTDGQTERVNQCMEMYLRCAVHDAPRKWRRWLPMAEFWYNSTFHASLNCTPFKALYGKEANLGAMSTWSTEAPAGDDLDWAAHTTQIRAQLERAQHRSKKQADRNRTERSFQVGEQVLLKLQPYIQQSVVNHPCAKLTFKFFGPYTVLEKIGPLAYKLELPPDSRVHPVFHVSQLKPFTPDYSPVFSDLPRVGPLSHGGGASAHPRPQDDEAWRPGHRATTSPVGEQLTCTGYVGGLRQSSPAIPHGSAIWDEASA